MVAVTVGFDTGTTNDDGRRVILNTGIMARLWLYERIVGLGSVGLGS